MINRLNIPAAGAETWDVPLNDNFSAIDAVLMSGAVRHAQLFAGGDMGAQMQAAHDDLPATGGILDASALNGTRTWSTTVNISKACKLILGVGTFTYTGTTQAINVSSNGVYIEGAGQNKTTIKYAGATAVQLIKFRNASSGIHYIRVAKLNTRFDAAAAASGSIQIYMVDPALVEIDSVYLSVDGNPSTPNMVNVGIKCEVITTGLVPPRGNIRLANIVHSNSNDGSATTGAIAIYLKGITGSNGGIQQVSLEGHSDIESSYVGLRCEFVNSLNQGGAWYYFQNKTNLQLVQSVSHTYIGPELSTSVAGGENCNFDGNCSDIVIINPVFYNPATMGTDSAVRTVILDNHTSVWKIKGIPFQLVETAFVNLPAASTCPGATMAVNNSNTATWGATIAGGGSNHVLAYSNGTNWTVAAK